MNLPVTSIKLIFSWRFLNKVAELVVIQTNTAWLVYGPTIVCLVDGYLLSKKWNPIVQLTFLNQLVVNLQEAIKFVTKHTNEKKVTFDDLTLIQGNYDSYAKIWNQLSMPENHVEISFINSSLSSYDECIRLINYYLIRSSKLSEKSNVETLSVLKVHGIDVPLAFSVQIQECLIFKCSEMDKKYKPDPKTFLLALESLTKDVETLLKPIDESLNTLIFLAERPSYILDNCLKKYKLQFRYFTTLQDSFIFSTNIEDLVMLDEIVKALEKDIANLTNGKISLKVVKSIIDLDFIRDQLQFDDEVEVIRDYLETKRKDSEDIGTASAAIVKNGLTAYSILFKIKDDLATLYETCQSFQLYDCINDPEMKEIQKIEKQLSCEAYHDQISLNDMVEKLNIVKTNLRIEDLETTLIFQLVSTVQKCAFLYSFCQYRKFASVEGYQNFISQHKLVTIAVDKEDYCEQILNELRGAMLFMSPFFHGNCTLSQLMNNLKSLTNVPVGIFQLNKVESNIHTIEVAFNQIEVLNCMTYCTHMITLFCILTLLFRARHMN